MAPRARRRDSWPLRLLVPLLGTALAVWIVGSVSGAYWILLLTQAGILAIAVIGLGFFVGRAGQVSFGHNAFIAVGAYATALGTTKWGLNPVEAAVLGLVAAAAIAVVLGIIALRLMGHYLALATFALGLGTVAVVTSSSWTGGSSGIAGVAGLSVFGWDLSSRINLFYTVWVVVLVSAVVVWRLGQLRFGLALRALAVDEDTARAVGISPLRYKVTALVVSALLCSVSGSLMAHSILFMSPDSIGFDSLLQLYLVMLIGGLAGIWGAVAGAVVVVALPQYLPGLQELRPTIFAAVLLIVLIIRPKGLLAPPSGISLERVSAILPAGRLRIAGRRILGRQPAGGE